MNIISLTVIEEQEQNPMTNFMYALKAPETRRQWPRRLKIFLDFLQLEGSVEEQARQFLSKAQQNTQWAQEGLIRFRVSNMKGSDEEKYQSLLFQTITRLPNYFAK